jgi:hypothetical protein
VGVEVGVLDHVGQRAVTAVLHRLQPLGQALAVELRRDVRRDVVQEGDVEVRALAVVDDEGFDDGDLADAGVGRPVGVVGGYFGVGAGEEQRRATRDRC